MNRFDHWLERAMKRFHILYENHVMGSDLGSHPRAKQFSNWMWEFLYPQIEEVKHGP